MAATMVVSQRPDVDIQGDISRLIPHYPPLQKDRRAIDTQVQNGVVTVSGHVQTPITRRYLLDRLPTIPGVTAIHADDLYDDESVRIEVGRAIPVGAILSRVFYGTVVLSGELPEGMTAEQLAVQVAAVPGVRRVVTNFQG